MSEKPEINIFYQGDLSREELAKQIAAEINKTIRRRGLNPHRVQDLVLYYTVEPKPTFWQRVKSLFLKRK